MGILSALKRASRIIYGASKVGNFKQDEYYVGNLAVFPANRRTGIGKALLIEAEKKAKFYKSKKIVLDVETIKTEAIDLYKKSGYEIENEINLNFAKNPFYFYRMIKILST